MRKVLIAGKNQAIVQTIERLINNMDPYTSVACLSLKEVEEMLKTETFDVLLIDAGFSASEEEKLNILARKIQPKIKILQHYGGGSGLLKTELEQLFT